MIGGPKASVKCLHARQNFCMSACQYDNAERLTSISFTLSASAEEDHERLTSHHHLLSKVETSPKEEAGALWASASALPGRSTWGM